MNRLLGAGLLWTHVARHAMHRRPTVTLAQRLAAWPKGGWPVSQPVSLCWNDHHMPFIAAETDEDLAVALGAVHAHLRLGQLAMARRLSQGRVAEMIGPVGVAADRLIHTLDMARAVPQIEALLPAETQRWLDGFVRGLNHYLAHVETLPEEFALFALDRAPWTVADILTLGRVVGADVTWMVQFRWLPQRFRADFPELWRRVTMHDVASSMSPATVTAHFAALGLGLGGAIRAGSNSFAVAAARSATGAALLASDPHLPLMLPGPWLAAAFKSPSYNAAGLMIPGLPFVALGRNPRLAWGGTSLHAASSDLVMVPAEARNQLRTREVEIRVRWSRPRRIRLRDSPWGPVISDLPFLRAGDDIVALRWMGHRASDEITAMLGANRARSGDEFRAALDGFAVPGQTMLYADSGGAVGKMIVAHLPRRDARNAPQLVTMPGPADGWDEIATGMALPAAVDPATGFVASANERTEVGDIVIGYHFSPPHRRKRLDALLSAQEHLSVTDAGVLQRDVHWAAALDRRDEIMTWIGDGEAGFGARERAALAALRDWDGDYATDSRGALAFELVSHHLARRLVPRARQRLYQAGWGTRALVWQDVTASSPQARRHAARQALNDTARAMARYRSWGGFHRVRLGHPLMLLPLVGRAWRVADAPAAGGAETLFKTAHGLTSRRHWSRFGSTARHIADLADPDGNFVTLLGGQDGWFGSASFADQWPLWQRGDHIRLPLRPETAAATFPHRTDLAP